jgi:hypothetical protein
MVRSVSGGGWIRLLKSIIAALRRTGYGKIWQMAKKKRKAKKFSAVDAVKAMARAQIGAPPAGRVVPDRREKKIGKHKPTLGKIMESE